MGAGHPSIEHHFKHLKCFLSSKTVSIKKKKKKVWLPKIPWKLILKQKRPFYRRNSFSIKLRKSNLKIAFYFPFENELLILVVSDPKGMFK